MYFSGADLAWLCREAVIKANYNSIKSPTGEFRKIISDLLKKIDQGCIP
jgi:SpoVK/Ycf46/Vps4 family AAA+-type ATPase